MAVCSKHYEPISTKTLQQISVLPALLLNWSGKRQPARPLKPVKPMKRFRRNLQLFSNPYSNY